MVLCLNVSIEVGTDCIACIHYFIYATDSEQDILVLC
jgi:hypothetical protein